MKAVLFAASLAFSVFALLPSPVARADEKTITAAIAKNDWLAAYAEAQRLAGNKDPVGYYWMAMLLADLHSQPEGIPRDPKESGRYYLLAAEGGVVPAMDRVSLYYERGFSGYPKDAEKALLWAERGLLKGNKGAAERYFSLAAVPAAAAPQRNHYLELADKACGLGVAKACEALPQSKLTLACVDNSLYSDEAFKLAGVSGQGAKKLVERLQVAIGKVAAANNIGLVAAMYAPVAGAYADIFWCRNENNISEAVRRALKGSADLRVSGLPTVGRAVRYVNYDRLIREVPLAESERQALLKAFEPRNAALQAEGAELEAMGKRIETLSGQARKDAEAGYVARSGEYRRATAAFKADLAQRREESYARIASFLNQAVIDFAAERGVAVVVNDPMWVSPELDLTQAVLDRIRK